MRRVNAVSKHDGKPQKTRIDWAEAKAYFVALPPQDRTFAAVSREFRVSTVSVRKHAHAEGWVAAADNADRKAEARGLAAAERTRAQQVEQAARIKHAAADRLEQRLLSDGELDDALVLRAWEAADKIWRLETDRSTENVAVAEVQAVIATVYQVAGRFVPREQREAFLAAVDEASAQLAIEGAAA